MAPVTIVRRFTSRGFSHHQVFSPYFYELGLSQM